MDTMVMAKPQQAAEALLVLDRKHLARYTLGDAALEAEILDLFVKQAPLTIARLKGAQDARQWKEAAHTLKGSARAIGAWRLAQVAEGCEAAGFPAPGECATPIDAVAVAFREVAGQIDAICVAAGRTPVTA